jgi:hypothetical protein
MAQGIEPSKHKALCSNPSTSKIIIIIIINNNFFNEKQFLKNQLCLNRKNNTAKECMSVWKIKP